jgi:hypothetical protein
MSYLKQFLLKQKAIVIKIRCLLYLFKLKISDNDIKEKFESTKVVIRSRN